MLTKWNTFSLLIMTLPIMGHVVILPLMIDVAGRDSVISILLSLPAAFLFGYSIYQLRKSYPNLQPKQLLETLLGSLGSKVLRYIFVLYFLFLTILSFATLVDFVYIGFFPETPVPALIICFLIIFIYATLKGYKRIALTAGALTFIALITGHTVTLMDSPKKDWSETLPFFEYGWSPSLWGCFILISIWVELLLLLCIPIEIKEKRMFLFWTIGILLNALMMFSTTNGAITIFGLGQASNFTYPAQEIVKIINLGFIDRFDIYGMILMLFGVYIRCSLFFRIAYDFSLSENASKWKERISFFLLMLITAVGTNYIAKDHMRVEDMIHIYTFMIVLYPIPFLLLFISWWKRRRNLERYNGEYI